eukprot:TRINITY_DN9571_c0_g2_i1.p1 TRINITY_DN9571_c0_g2~~TRINITY_DN9571_c0_g2_i1.p1  ORF type:complete len:613 (-),score=166.51 TRINITY_DN9571_c0_g2_i1:49-1887(-)
MEVPTISIPETALVPISTVIAQTEVVVTFTVSYETKWGDIIAVVGDCDELGNWDPSAGLSLTTDPSIFPLWRGSIKFDVSATRSINYKYLVKRGGKVVRWESLKQNRNVLLQKEELQITIIDAFGSNAEHNLWIDWGWLHNDYQLIFKPHPIDGSSPFKMYDGITNDLSIDIRPLQGSRLPPEYLAQDNLVMESDLYFSYTAPTFDDLGISIELYSDPSKRDWIGRAYLTSAEMKSLRGSFTRPIFSTSNAEIIGEFSGQFLVIAPMKHPKNNISQTRHNSESVTPTIGHRGLGQNAQSRVSENTILSFVTAEKYGFQCLEFDVQLTKDLVPVIYHDFAAKVSNFKVPISTFTLAEFHELHKEDAPKNQEKPKVKRQNSLENIKSNSNPTNTNNKFRLSDRFPTLEDVFKQVPINVAYNIELKYPPELEKEKQFNAPERNLYLDKILSSVYEHAYDRPLFFSCFDPDLCIMCSRKQARYPVFFLTTGGQKLVQDPVMNSIPEAIRLCQFGRLRGIVTESTPIIKKPELVKEVKEAGFLLFTYGALNNDLQNFKLQKELGVDSIISDRLIDLARQDSSIGLKLAKKRSTGSPTSNGIQGDSSPPADSPDVTRK